MCPGGELNPQPFGYWTMLQATESHQPGQNLSHFFFNFKVSLTFILFLFLVMEISLPLFEIEYLLVLHSSYLEGNLENATLVSVLLKTTN